MLESYDRLWQAIIRPERIHPELSELASDYLHVDGLQGNTQVVRHLPWNLNVGSSELSGSLFVPISVEEANYKPDLFPRPTSESKVVVYLHSQSMSRAEGSYLVKLCCGQGISVLLFDFGGCGLSSGKYITLGVNESAQTIQAVKWLRSKGYQKIVLWGKSMGAASAIFASKALPELSGLVLDSPFLNLEQTLLNVANQTSSLPQFCLKGGLLLLRKTIQKEAGFDISEVNPGEAASDIKVPTYLLVGQRDQTVLLDDIRRLHSNLKGEKHLRIIEEAQHGDSRADYPHVLKEVQQFLIDKFEMKPNFTQNPYSRLHNQNLDQMLQKNTRPKISFGSSNALQLVSRSKCVPVLAIKPTFQVLLPFQIQQEKLAKPNLGQTQTALKLSESRTPGVQSLHRPVSAHVQRSSSIQLINQNSVHPQPVQNHKAEFAVPPRRVLPIAKLPLNFGKSFSSDLNDQTTMNETKLNLHDVSHIRSTSQLRLGSHRSVDPPAERVQKKLSLLLGQSIGRSYHLQKLFY